MNHKAAGIMFKLSKSAAAEIKRSLQQHEFDDLPIRIAARRDNSGTIHYQMGFDQAGSGDLMLACSGVDVVIANVHKHLLHGAEMDFVTLEDGSQNFIFLNPNDPAYVPPDTDGDGETAN